MSTLDIPLTTSGTSGTASPLRRLYLARFAFAVVWAGLFAATGSTLGALAAVLLVVYPAVDALAAILDARATAAAGAYVNIAVSTVTAVGLGIAATTAQAPQTRSTAVMSLVVALSRRRLGGQWAMIASGGLSVPVGASFIASAPDATSMTSLAGYATLGGVFFLVSALRLGRSREDPATITA